MPIPPVWAVILEDSSSGDGSLYFLSDEEQHDAAPNR